MFGKRVIGQEAWEAQEAAAKLARDHGAGFGVRVTGPLTPPAEEPAKKPDEGSKDKPSTDSLTSTDKSGSKDVETKVPLSVKQVEAALSENTTPAFFDVIMDAEFARVEGPRKGGLRFLLKTERDRDESRPAIVAELAQALKV